MKVSSVTVATLACVATLSGAQELSEEPTSTTTSVSRVTHRYGRFDHTSRVNRPNHTGTHSYGRFNHTSRDNRPNHTGTHSYGRFNHTSRDNRPNHTGTHSYGRFNHTSRDNRPDHTGTASYGRFNHTSRDNRPDHTGTASYGRFNHTSRTLNIEEQEARENSGSRSGSNLGPLKVLGLTVGSAVVAGGMLLL
ncbi:hypothetical protein HG535_0G01310 [Zygotorulaspora mrakii]|uniref:Hydrophilin n=1 Tax=Zygotorulaspora mrakii TaxID=42260 RepID=A0A7H9B6Q9_ZYGMR|nr:uncharacterized protein HG535_0G01310 [Zygotorulaspora mrakii]QLG74247.1 hypothetical protein HG535_0G01310 [Zygotorulaspora mrakii]